MNKPPKHLSASARKLWQQLADEIELDAGGALMLTLLCEACDRRDQARAAIAKEGATYVDRFGQHKVSPWVAIERDSTLAVQRAYHALGLDLASEAS